MWPAADQLDQLPACSAIHTTMSSHACGLTPDAAGGPFAIHDLQVLRMEVASFHIIGPVMCPPCSCSRIEPVMAVHQPPVGAVPADRL